MGAVDDRLRNKLADLYGGYIDLPQQAHYSNPTYGFDPGFTEFQKKLSAIVGVPMGGPQSASPYNPQQFGELQNRPQYRGIRMLLPQSGGDYDSLTTGRIPGHAGMQQELMGEMIRRGYPVLGGTGPMPGFRKDFNPVGFGQR